MKCLIQQPNRQSIEFYLNNNATGRDCLNRICDFLQIIEKSFFGLQFINRNGNPSWLKLRKRVDQQIKFKRTVKLYFRVKFYVLPQYIQQDVTKYQFYLNVCQHLRKGRSFLMLEEVKRIKMIALIAQIEYGDYTDDSYDIKILYSKWLSISLGLRSMVECQRSNLKDNASFNLADELNNIANNNNSNNDCISTPNCLHCDLLRKIIFWHQTFQGFSQRKSINTFLKESWEMTDLGVEYFKVFYNNKRIFIGIGPRGLSIHDDGTEHRVSYNKMKEITIHKTNHLLAYHFIIEIRYNGDRNSIIEQKFRTYSKVIAETIRRLLAERKTFYSCSHIESSTLPRCKAQSQYKRLNDFVQIIRSSPSTLLKKQNKNNEKTHIFDLDQTLQQSYDDIRRYIYHYNLDFSKSLAANNNSSSENPKTQHAVQPDSVLKCKICLDYQLEVTFIPCGHTCCQECFQNIKNDSCPFCKNQISNSQKIFI